MHQLLVSALICAVPLFSVHAQTVDEIIAKNIEARGGLERIKAIQTLRASGEFTGGDFRAVFVQENKRPGKVREEQTIQGMTAIDAYDGKIAWRVSPFEGRKDPDFIAEDDRKPLLEDADFDGMLVDYKNKDHVAELLGHDNVEGTDCYKIKLRLASGDTRYYYIDADSFLELKVETERNIRGTVRYSEVWYGDYEKAGGVYFPFAIESGMKGSSNRLKITIDKIDVNVPLADALFSMPAARAK